MVFKVFSPPLLGMAWIILLFALSHPLSAKPEINAEFKKDWDICSNVNCGGMGYCDLDSGLCVCEFDHFNWPACDANLDICSGVKCVGWSHCNSASGLCVCNNYQSDYPACESNGNEGCPLSPLGRCIPFHEYGAGGTCGCRNGYDNYPTCGVEWSGVIIPCDIYDDSCGETGVCDLKKSVCGCNNGFTNFPQCGDGPIHLCHPDID